MILQAAIVFFTLFALDVVWARYTLYLNGGHRWRAGGLAAAIIALGSFSTINYVDNHWMIIPAMAGAFCGTWIGTKAAPISG